MDVRHALLAEEGQSREAGGDSCQDGYEGERTKGGLVGRCQRVQETATQLCSAVAAIQLVTRQWQIPVTSYCPGGDTRPTVLEWNQNCPVSLEGTVVLLWRCPRTLTQCTFPSCPASLSSLVCSVTLALCLYDVAMHFHPHVYTTVSLQGYAVPSITTCTIEDSLMIHH